MSNNCYEGHEYYVHELRKAGETIIKNAKSIVGDEAGLCDVTVSIRLTPDNLTIINVDKNLYPDHTVDELCGVSGYDDDCDDM